MPGQVVGQPDEQDYDLQVHGQEDNMNDSNMSLYFKYLYIISYYVLLWTNLNF